jgi:hypothetical protein
VGAVADVAGGLVGAVGSLLGIGDHTSPAVHQYVLQQQAKGVDVARAFNPFAGGNPFLIPGLK